MLYLFQILILSWRCWFATKHNRICKMCIERFCICTHMPLLFSELNLKLGSPRRWRIGCRVSAPREGCPRRTWRRASAWNASRRSPGWSCARLLRSSPWWQADSRGTTLSSSTSGCWRKDTVSSVSSSPPFYCYKCIMSSKTEKIVNCRQ